MPHALADALAALSTVGGLSGLAALLTALTALRRRDADMRAVRTAVEPNHGSSLADSIRRTEATVTDLSRRLGHEVGELRRDVADVRADLRQVSQDHAERLRHLEDD